MDILAAYLANQPASNKKTRNRGKRKRFGNNAAIAFFARQTLVALDEGVIHPGIDDPIRPAPNFAYADLLELRELVHDVLLHRDTSERRNNPIFGQLSTFAKDGTSPFSVAFRHWKRRYDEWKEASTRTWGICGTPTKTDFLRQTLDDSADDPANLHPFYSCPTATADAQNIWTLPAAPEWWHDALWQLGDETWTHLRPESEMVFVHTVLFAGTIQVPRGAGQFAEAPRRNKCTHMCMAKDTPISKNSRTGTSSIFNGIPR